MQAMYEVTPRMSNINLQFEDIAFDYFGILEMQLEGSRAQFKDDQNFMDELKKRRKEVSEEVKRDMEITMSDTVKNMTATECKKHMETIRQFTNKVIDKYSNKDPMNGQSMLRTQDPRYEIDL